MSQHLYATTHESQPVTILMGWDRPLQGYFMLIERTDTKDADYLYSNLGDPDLLHCMGLPNTVHHFLDVLENLGLSVPATMLVEIGLDAANNVGNRFVRYLPDGSVQAPG
jgi:hypothetical protein